jgi:acyl carrier protein
MGNDIPTRLANLLVKHFDIKPEQLADHSAVHFAQDLNLDSLDMVELLMAVEEDFDVEISDAEAMPFADDSGVIPANAMADFEALIARKVAAKA